MKNRTLLLLLLVAGIFMPVMAQQEMQPLPIDPKVRYGKLTNGLTYYIRHNEHLAMGREGRLGVAAVVSPRATNS